jgi:hypothetical protein
MKPSEGVAPKQYSLRAEATAIDKLEIAVQALKEICKKDGPGCDLSPAGDCYYIANEALAKITSRA